MDFRNRKEANMKIGNKINIALCSVAMVTAVSVGADVNAKLIESEKMIATLREEVEAKNNSIQELEDSTKSLQEELNQANEELASVKEDVEDIKN